MSEAAYRIVIDGNDVSSAFNPLLISLTITDSDGGKADTCELELDDTGGQIALPAPGAAIEALLWWVDPPAGASAGAVQFTGVTDEPKSHGSRSRGRVLSISAKSADLKGKGKHKNSKHKDNSSFGDVAKQWGSAAGYQVSVDSSLAAVQRDYWTMANESFLAWGTRIADDLGATFKTAFPKAAFVPLDSGSSASGAALAGVTATAGINLIEWDVAPTLSRGIYQNAKVRWYDHAKAQWNVASESVGDGVAEADLTDTFKAADQGRATTRAKGRAAKTKRKKGEGHSVEIDGDPGAMSQANLTIAGARPGVDGQYRIKTATHKYVRGGGWTTHCVLDQPQGAAGTDSRAKASSSDATSASDATSVSGAYNPLSSGGTYSPGT
jgi:phage protein D